MVLNTALCLWPDNLQMLEQAEQILCPSSPSSGATPLEPEHQKG